MIATQNPVEHHGTYPLPEAQLDRFAMKLRIGYPESVHEREMLQDAIGSARRNHHVDAVLSPAGLAALQEEVAQVAVGPAVLDYLVTLARFTREHKQVTLGLSPRGLLTWQRVAQAWAFLKQRDFVTPDDVQDVAVPVLGVRLGVDADASGHVLAEILESVTVPVFPTDS